jgi:phosphoribosylformimino-5-aminoimidazole carboxamide ribotide isomerase
MHGLVVRGIAGQRDQYRPIVSTLTNSAQPLDVANALHDRFGFDDLYVADLDAIGGASPAFAILDEIAAARFSLWVDIGIRTANNVSPFAARSSMSAVVGLETVQGPDVLKEICARLTPRVVFSLDLKNGQPLGDLAAWGTSDPLAIAQHAIAAGVGRLLVLDLAHVGVGAGTGTDGLCKRLRREHPQLEIATGGGVRGPDDVRRLHAAGVDYVLVASALHDGRLTPEAVAELQKQP